MELSVWFLDGGESRAIFRSGENVYALEIHIHLGLISHKVRTHWVIYSLTEQVLFIRYHPVTSVFLALVFGRCPSEGRRCVWR